MRRYADRKGGQSATPDGFDRSDTTTLAALTDQWLAWLQERNYSQRTISATTWAMRTFLAWSQERDLIHASQITKPILESYQRHLYRYRKDNGQPISITTQRSRLGAIQRLFAWLCKHNLLTANPAADLELPRKPPKTLPKALTLAEIDSILSVPDTADPLGIRDRAILELFYATGIRRAELVRIDLEDIDHQRATLAIRKGKGGKDRTVPIGERALHWIQRYLDTTRPLLHINQNEHALFPTGYGERFSAGYIGNWVKRTMKQAGIDRTGSCHLLRHSCATHMLENGADIRYIQQLLGHARLDTTQLYTQVSIIQLREVHARTHPHAKQ